MLHSNSQWGWMLGFRLIAACSLVPCLSRACLGEQHARADERKEEEEEEEERSHLFQPAWPTIRPAYHLSWLPSPSS